MGRPLFVKQFIINFNLKPPPLKNKVYFNGKDHGPFKHTPVGVHVLRRGCIWFTTIGLFSHWYKIGDSTSTGVRHCVAWGGGGGASIFHFH